MRRFADTLPTLREGAAATAPPILEDGRVSGSLLARALGERTATPDAMAIAAAAPMAREREAGRWQPVGAARPASPPRARPASPPPMAPHRAAKGGGTSPIPPLDGPSHTLEDEIAATLARAQAEAAVAREAAVEAARQAEREAAAKTLEDARAAWCEREAGALREALHRATETLQERLSSAFALALAPIAEAAIRDAAVRRFASVVDDLVGLTATDESVVVRGPADLLAALERALGPGAGVTLEEAGTPDLVVRIGPTRLETTIAAWAEDLAAALGQGHAHAR